jgi:hypothetical protein
MMNATAPITAVTPKPPATMYWSGKYSSIRQSLCNDIQSDAVLETDHVLVRYPGVIIGIAFIAIEALIIAQSIRKKRGQIQVL